MHFLRWLIFNKYHNYFFFFFSCCNHPHTLPTQISICNYVTASATESSVSSLRSFSSACFPFSFLSTTISAALGGALWEVPGYIAGTLPVFPVPSVASQSQYPLSRGCRLESCSHLKLPPLTSSAGEQVIEQISRLFLKLRSWTYGQLIYTEPCEKRSSAIP